MTEAIVSVPRDCGPEIEFLGHAGFMIRHRGISLLCDPWLSEEGAFLHAWHQFPPNHFLDPTSLWEADFLFLSHDHADHFDRPFLRSFPKDRVTVLLADFLADTFAREVERLGFSRVLRLADWEPFTLGEGFSVQVVRDQSLFKVDSALIVDVGGYRFVDRNDCHISDEYRARLRKEGVDVLLSQFSGAMWYPAVYAYPPERQRQIAAELRKTLLDKFVARSETIGARHVLHAAGPPCFLDDEFLLLNYAENGIFHDQQDVFPELQARLSGTLHLVLPGDRLTFQETGELQVEHLHSFDFSRKAEVLEEYRERRQSRIRAYLRSLPSPEAGFLRRFMRHLGALFGVSRLLRQRSNVLVRFRIAGPHGGDVWVDTRNGRFSIKQDHSEPPGYEFFLDGRIARLLVDEEEHWEEVLLSLRVRARRNPDDYNWPLFALLRYGHDPRLIRRIEATLEAGASEQVEVWDRSNCYLIQRYCPHSGEDLTHAQVRDGLLICPRHHWTFNLLGGGACVRGGNIPLRVYEVREDEEREGEV